jgi:hypothetical protein
MPCSHAAKEGFSSEELTLVELILVLSTMAPLEDGKHSTMNIFVQFLKRLNVE